MAMIGKGLILLGIFFISTGVFSILRYKDFYTRILLTSKVDTIGMISISLGVVLIQGLDFFSLKVLLVLLVMLFVAPLMTHYVARTAYFSSQDPVLDEEDDHA
jgi:multicomponent Na+:H+ antiporter subunit G